VADLLILPLHATGHGVSYKQSGKKETSYNLISNVLRKSV
jgi:hypothetical protein